MLTKVIPSYPYVQYNDDPNIVAFFRAYNAYAQEYVDWFNQINLPIYTGDLISGTLLDWVALGLYGSVRPVLPSGTNKAIGAYNTAEYNVLAYNAYKLIGPKNFFVTTDDVFKRILTWNFYKGDGDTFNVRWLKRRIMRFLNGPNGTDPHVDQTYQISVTFGADNQVNINIVSGIRTVTGGAFYNRAPYNTTPYNALESTFQELVKFDLAPILQAAINSGAVQLPFQYHYVVSI